MGGVSIYDKDEANSEGVAEYARCSAIHVWTDEMNKGKYMNGCRTEEESNTAPVGEDLVDNVR